MQQTEPNFYKWFVPTFNNTHPSAFSCIPSNFYSVNCCKCSSNACNLFDKPFVNCCHYCIASVTNSDSKPISTLACQVSRAQPQGPLCCCSFYRKCPICLVRRLCRETFDAYRKETTPRERYSIFDGGQSTSHSHSAKTKKSIYYGVVDQVATVASQISKARRKGEPDRREGDKKLAQKTTKSGKNISTDSRDDISKKNTKQKRAIKIAKSKLEDTNKSDKKISQLRSESNQPVEKKLDRGKRSGKNDIEYGLNDDLRKSGKNNFFNKGGTRKEKLVDRVEDDESVQNKKGKPQKIPSKGKLNAFTDSDNEALLRGKIKKGQKREQYKNSDKGLVETNKDTKYTKIKGRFQRGDENQAKGKNKGGQVLSIAENETTGAEGRFKGIATIISDNEQASIRSSNRKRNPGKVAATYTRIQENEDMRTVKEKHKRNRWASRSKASSLRIDPRDLVDSAQKDGDSVDENLIGRLYKRKIEKHNATGRKLTMPDYMRIRLEQRDLKYLNRKKSSETRCDPCRSDGVSCLCKKDQPICIARYCCSPPSYFC